MKEYFQEISSRTKERLTEEEEEKFRSFLALNEMMKMSKLKKANLLKASVLMT